MRTFGRCKKLMRSYGKTHKGHEEGKDYMEKSAVIIRHRIKMEFTHERRM